MSEPERGSGYRRQMPGQQCSELTSDPCPWPWQWGSGEDRLETAAGGDELQQHPGNHGCQKLTLPGMVTHAWEEAGTGGFQVPAQQFIETLSQEILAQGLGM